MKRITALTLCIAAWLFAALLEGLTISGAVVFAWAHDTRRDAGRGVRSLWGRR